MALTRSFKELVQKRVASDPLLLYVTNYKKGLTAPWRGPGPDVCCLQSRQRSLLRDAAGLALARRAMWRWP